MGMGWVGGDGGILVVEGGVDHHHGLEVLGHLLVLGQAVEQLLLERVTPAEGAGVAVRSRCCGASEGAG